MAKAKRKAHAGDVATNRQASFRYELLDRLETGIVLQGTEVKSLRSGSAQLKDAYASVRDGELWLHNLHIAPYGLAARDNHEPERPRKLPAPQRATRPAHTPERPRGGRKTRGRGRTRAPARLYFKGPRAKVEIALARGKDRF